jgi:DNA-directed RNA polymerase subunit RPC12/RpoP
MPDKSKSQPQNGDSGSRPPVKVATFEIPSDRFVCYVCRAMVLKALRVLPHMAAYVCHDCAAKPDYQPIRESDLAGKSYAPWSDQEVSSVNAYQLSDFFLPFVCNYEHHLMATKDGLVCPECIGFKIPWAYSWMLDGTWQTT